MKAFITGLHFNPSKMPTPLQSENDPRKRFYPRLTKSLDGSYSPEPIKCRTGKLSVEAARVSAKDGHRFSQISSNNEGTKERRASDFSSLVAGLLRGSNSPPAGPNCPRRIRNSKSCYWTCWRISLQPLAFSLQPSNCAGGHERSAEGGTEENVSADAPEQPVDVRADRINRQGAKAWRCYFNLNGRACVPRAIAPPPPASASPRSRAAHPGSYN